MFTGIIESTAKILKITDAGIVLARPPMFQDLKIGCSIAVSGVCLSVIAFDDASISFDVVPMTLKKTKLGSLSVGDMVNLERAMKADGRFEGHIVTGHCEGTGVVVAVSGSAPIHAPTPGPSPWPSIAYANVGQQGEGSSALTQFDRLQERVWNGTSESKHSPHVIVERARAMRGEPTSAEKKLWDVLKGDNIDNIRFRRQHPIGNYIVDFFADTLKLAIEVDGEIHLDPELKEYELHRTENLNSRGISVMRFSNDDILHRFNDVIAAIYAFSRSPLTQLSAGADLGEGSGVGANAPGKNGMEATAGISLTVRVPKPLLPYIVPHGSITLDGVALTVADVRGEEITVALIPHTLAQTTLGSLSKESLVNIETDILGKYILKAHGHQ